MFDKKKYSSYSYFKKVGVWIGEWRDRFVWLFICVCVGGGVGVCVMCWGVRGGVCGGVGVCVGVCGWGCGCVCVFAG